MESVSREGRVLHVVPPGPRPPELSSPPDGHTVVAWPDGDAPEAEWDRALDLVIAHEVVVPW